MVHRNISLKSKVLAKKNLTIATTRAATGITTA